MQDLIDVCFYLHYNIFYITFACGCRCILRTLTIIHGCIREGRQLITSLEMCTMQVGVVAYGFTAG